MSVGGKNGWSFFPSEPDWLSVDGSGGVAAYLFGFVAPTQVGYVHLVGVRADSRRAGSLSKSGGGVGILSVDA